MPIIITPYVASLLSMSGDGLYARVGMLHVPGSSMPIIITPYVASRPLGLSGDGLYACVGMLPRRGPDLTSRDLHLTTSSHNSLSLYTCQICRALAAIHAMGVCHRDIKPQNLLVNTSTHQVRRAKQRRERSLPAATSTPSPLGARVGYILAPLTPAHVPGQGSSGRPGIHWLTGFSADHWPRVPLKTCDWFF